jgi:hypothetical protein
MKRTFFVALGLAVTACNFGSKGEQTDRPLPEPEPSSKTPPARPAEATPTPPRPRESDKPAAPATATAEANPTSKAEPATKPDAAKSAPTSTASAPAPVPAPTLTLPPVDGGLSIPTAACIQKCQGRLQACMSKPVALDGGLPSLDSMSECKKAFEDCRGDCS